MTKEISVEESFDYFITTLGRYDESHLNLSDDELLYIILEELDIEAVTFLHNTTIDRLIVNKLISSDIAFLADELRNMTLTLLQDKRSIKDIRNDPDWKAVGQFASHIKNKIKPRFKAET